MPLGVFITPDNSLPVQLHAQHLIVKRAEVRPLAQQRGGRACVSAGGEFQYFLSIRDANSAKDFVAAGQIDDTAGDHRCGVDVVAGGEVPQRSEEHTSELQSPMY